MQVTVTGLDAHLGEVPIVTGVDLDIPTGGFVGILGPNGSGKSTLLRTLYRALRPTGGVVRVGGDDVWNRLSARHAAARVAAMVQHNDNNLDLTVREVTALGGSALVSRQLANVGLAHKADARFSTLSGGEKQRVHLARALCQQPRVLVLDEPTNHLDLRHQIELLDHIEGLALTTIMVTHDLNVAARYCEHAYLMRAGRIAAAGALTDVLSVETIAEVFGVAAEIGVNTRTGRPSYTFSALRTDQGAPA
ncbi:ABC transporter ATP-binding protein [Nocardia sp. NBC_00511]|uniref:ABC transporter ATP-binding protein n=1 Tax=Nocardia sp. NBC_00511 TaxID=2903591 RepID=UPI0030E3D539